MEFLSIFGKVAAKNRAFGNNIIFLQQFISISGGGTFLVFPTGVAYGENACRFCRKCTVICGRIHDSQH